MLETALEARRGSVLVVDDEAEIVEEIRQALLANGHDVEIAETVGEALRAARKQAPSVLIVDRMLQGEDGLTIIETLRSEGNVTPALVISGLSTVDDRIDGLMAGGDDYLIKPFALRELAARVEALLRRSPDRRVTRLRAGAIEVDLVERRVVCDGREIDLSPREFKLLEYFMRRPGEVVTRVMLLENVCKFSSDAATHVVDVHVFNLRRKLDPRDSRRFIVNVRGLGFRLNAGR